MVDKLQRRKAENKVQNLRQVNGWIAASKWMDK